MNAGGPGCPGDDRPEDLSLFRVMDEVEEIPALIEAYHRREDRAGFHVPVG